MSLRTASIIIFLSLTFNIALSQETGFNSNLKSFKELKTNFTDPPAKYRTAPFYVWNDSITEQQIDEILSDYKLKGIGGVFIHARPGLITEFLSDKWYKLVNYAVEKGKSLGMQIWIYDENTYPSGNAGGHVPVIMPESNNQGSGILITSSTKFPDKMDKPYFIILKQLGEKFVEITNNFEAEKGKEGAYYYCEKKFYRKSPWFAGNTYVDLLNPDVTKTFVKTIMKGYEGNCKEEFGKSIPGVFTDEPGIYIEQICWTPALFKTFENHWGYDLKLNLPSLSYEVGDWKKVRHDYFSVISDLLVNGFAKPYSEYCNNNDLIFTGHFLEHDWPSPAMTPDFMAMQAYENMPGMDDLFNQYDESVNAQFGNIRMPREARSVASQRGRSRVLSETYGGSGWDLSFQDMKRIADWQFAGGINFVNQHLSFTTIKGWRKRDYPQSFSSHEPWWYLYKNMVDYTARMSLAMSSGEQLNNVMVIEPTTTAWMYYSRNEKNKKFDELGVNFTNFINDLEKYQVEYDLGSEKNIESFGKVENGKFIIGQRAYGIVVIPPGCENLDNTTFGLVEMFMKQGGKVADYTEIPSFVDGIATYKVKQLSAQYPDQWKKVHSVSEKQSLSIILPKDFKIAEPDKIKGKLLHQRRKLDEGEIILLTNTGKEYWSRGKMHVSGKSVAIMDANTGNMLPYPAVNKGNYTEVAFEIPQCGSLLLYVSNETAASSGQHQNKTSLKILSPLSPVKAEITKPNTLTLDFCDLKFNDGLTENDLYVVDAGNKIYRYYGMQGGDPWSNPQYKTQYIDSAKFPENSGFEATYHLVIDKGVDLANIQASVEQSNLWKLVVNGTTVDPKPDETWLDRHFSLYDIGNYLKEGNNELKLVASEMTIYSELESVYILGKFGIEASGKGFKIVPQKQIELGSWKEQGLKMYSNAVTYSNTYKINRENKHFILALDSWNGTIADVTVNSKQAGVIYCEPFELDITDHLMDGENTIAVSVFGSLKNLLGPHHSKVAGMAGPGDFATAPKHQPSGYNYNTVDYGLYTDFKIVEVTGDQQRYYYKKDHPVPEKVSDPLITIDKQASNNTSKKVIITEGTKGADIYYTTDGSDPTVKSKQYKNPLELAASAGIKAIAIKKGGLQSNVVLKNVVFGINIINAVYKHDYTKYNAGGKDGLFDGERGTESFTDGKWQGFELNDMDITFELVKQQQVNTITVGFLEQINSWIYFPTQVEISVSLDGKEFKQVALFTKDDILKIEGNPIKDISVFLIDTQAKFIRVFAKNIEKCPVEDPGSGGEAWIFADEVIIN